jgi:3-hydroxyisobutyrate dehydrogenase-like beta-hydroxyacid dehydrogenase
VSDVTVIGLGEMGTALAEAFLRAGRNVTVWNRTMGKAEPLLRKGANTVPNAAEAVRASALTIICVSDYTATQSILEVAAAGGALLTRTVVQLSTGTPREARELDGWVRGHGAEYLDGGILAWPSQIGGPHTLIYLSGPQSTLSQHEPLLRTLGGGLTHLGEDISSSAAMFAAILSYLAGRWIGICHGAAVCQAEGLDVEAFGETLALLSPALAADSRHMGKVIARGLYTNPESTLKTAGQDVERLVRQAEEAGIGTEWPRFAAGLFLRAIDAGHGVEEHAALIKILR